MITPTTDKESLPSLDYSVEQGRLSTLLASWSEEDKSCGKRRELRQNKRSVTEEIQKGTILDDETIIPDRTISSNIRRSKTTYNNYVTQSQRILIISNIEKPEENIESLELWFTRGMRFPGWKRPYFKNIDSVHVHGGNPMEVVYDPSKPLNVSLEYIPRRELIIPLKSRNLQNNPRILRLYEVTSIQLQEFADIYGFDKAIADELLQRLNSKDDFISIYRVMMKVDGVVYNAWFSKGASSWLREPVVHDIGLFNFDPAMLSQLVEIPDMEAAQQMAMQQPQPFPMGGTGMEGMMMQQAPMQMPTKQVPLYLTPQWDQIRGQFMQPAPLHSYPIFWFPFQVTECDELLDEQGRVSMDLHVQEAMTSLLSDTVNAAHRASGLYPCVENEPGGDPNLSELGPVKRGVIMSRRLIFNEFPWPNPILLPVMQALKIGKADESGQADFAAVARKDANKTATEMTLATDQANAVQIDDMDVFSDPYLQMNALAFNIACHQAIFHLCKQPTHPEFLIGDYNLQSASDTEVVKREQDKANAKEFFNIVKGTPAAEKLLQFLLERYFPDQKDQWLAILAQPDKNLIIEQLVSIIETIPANELPPEQRLAINTVVATARSLVGQPNDGGTPGAPGAPQGAAAAPSNEGQQAVG